MKLDRLINALHTFRTENPEVASVTLYKHERTPDHLILQLDSDAAVIDFAMERGGQARRKASETHEWLSVETTSGLEVTVMGPARELAKSEAA